MRASLQHEVPCLLHGSLFLCEIVFWCLVMSSLVGAQSLIDCWDQCVFGSVSYLIFSDKISSGVFVVCCLVFVGVFLVLFFSHGWDKGNAYVFIITSMSMA